MRVSQHRPQISACRSPRQARGVALLEALAALTIFAIAVVGLGKSINAAARFATEARMVSQVTRSMENALEEALHRPVIEAGETTSEPDADGLVVTTIIREAEIENGDGQLLSGMFEVEVNGVIPGASKDEERVWQLRTLCYPPLYAGSR